VYQSVSKRYQQRGSSGKRYGTAFTSQGSLVRVQHRPPSSPRLRRQLAVCPRQHPYFRAFTLKKEDERLPYCTTTLWISRFVSVWRFRRPLLSAMMNRKRCSKDQSFAYRRCSATYFMLIARYVLPSGGFGSGIIGAVVFLSIRALMSSL
jgi:hypothetical protein